jgi:L-alanine-DL-glutamate epimerase-like enolase superfamily enzyme
VVLPRVFTARGALSYFILYFRREIMSSKERNIKDLRITEIETIPLSIPVIHDLFVAKGGKYTTFDPILVKIHTNFDVTGIGEVEAFPAYDRLGPDSPKGCVQLLDEILIPLLIGLNPFDIELIHKTMDRRVEGHQWVKAGIDITLWDLMGKVMNVPSYYLLGGCVYDRAPVEGVGYGIPLLEPDEVAKIAKGAVDKGYIQLELKVGDPDPSKDIARIKATREAVGPMPSIKMDFNKGYNVKTAINTILEMEKYGINWVEQPVDYWNLDGLREIRNAIHTPLVVDESVNTATDMVNVIKAGAADAVHLKPTVKGGITESRRIEHVAAAAGIEIIPGVLCPTGVGMGAVHTFMASCRLIHRGIHGSPLDLLAEDIVKDPIPEGSPYVYVSHKVGLGFELDDAQVKKFMVPK